MLKKRLIIAITAAALIGSIQCINYNRILIKQDLSKVTEEKQLLEEELSIAKADVEAYRELTDNLQLELVKYHNPIQYDSAAAPTYSSLPLSEDLQQYTYSICEVYGIVDYYPVVLAVMWRESDFKADTISATNDYGLMQINKCNHKYLKENLGLVDMLDPYDNIEGGVYILSELIEKYSDINKALMAYNMGPSNASAQWRRGNYTSAYSRDVLAKVELIELNQYSK